MRRWRRTTWVIVIWNVLIAVWLVAGLSGIEQCTGDYVEACEAGTAIGAGLGITVILGLWFIVLIPLSILWFATRPKD